jgi:hypothetical protein
MMYVSIATQQDRYTIQVLFETTPYLTGCSAAPALPCPALALRIKRSSRRRVRFRVTNSQEDRVRIRRALGHSHLNYGRKRAQIIEMVSS